MRAIASLLLTTAMSGTLVAHASTPGVLADCATTHVRPESVDLNCLRSDAMLTSLTWNQRTARGYFSYPSYSARAENGVVTLTSFSPATPAYTNHTAGEALFCQKAVTLEGAITNLTPSGQVTIRGITLGDGDCEVIADGDDYKYRCVVTFVESWSGALAVDMHKGVTCTSELPKDYPTTTTRADLGTFDFNVADSEESCLLTPVALPAAD